MQNNTTPYLLHNSKIKPNVQHGIITIDLSTLKERQIS